MGLPFIKCQPPKNEADHLSDSKTVPDVCREIGVTAQTYYRWRNKYAGMSPDMIKQLRELQKENARLRRVVSDQAIDIAILKEVARGNL
jgi:putative transposase